MGRLVRSVVVCIALIAFAPAEGADPPRFSVEVTVTGSNEATRTAVVSYIGRELRALNDVYIVSTDADYRLSVIVEDLTIKMGSASLGYAISSNFVRVLKIGPTIDAASKDQAAARILRFLVRGAVSGNLQALKVVDRTALAEACRDTVNEIDGAEFELRRVAVKNLDLQIKSAK